jgi:hypothetical protein
MGNTYCCIEKDKSKGANPDFYREDISLNRRNQSIASNKGSPNKH